MPNKTSKNNPIKTRAFSLYALASGKPGRKFSEQEFLELTSQAKFKPTRHLSERFVRLDDGYIYHADSSEEVVVIKKLITRKAFVRLRGQAFAIPYRFAGKDHEYYPDMVLLTKTGKIVFIEVKQLAQMNSKVNLRKYAALKRFCDMNGYLYMMCDKKFNVYDRLHEEYVMPCVREAIENAITDKGYFGMRDYKMLIGGQDHRRIEKMRKSIGVYVATHDDVKMVGDLTYKIKDLLIKRKG